MRVISKYVGTKGDMDGTMKVTFEVSNYYQRELLKKLKPDSDYLLEIKKIKDKRSIQQNRFMWKLLQQIAEVQNGDKDAEPIYIQALIRANASSDYICAIEATEATLKKQFRAIKYIKKVLVNGTELNMYQVFIGSSNFNVSEMSELIDCVLDIANECGIQTDYWADVLK